MVALMLVVLDERLDLFFQITGQDVMLEQYPVLQRLVPAFDLALCLRMIWCAANVAHLVVCEPVSDLTRDIAGPISRR